jgi:hypothetical protein
MNAKKALNILADISRNCSSDEEPLGIKYQREKAQREAETDEDEPLILKYLRETTAKVTKATKAIESFSNVPQLSSSVPNTKPSLTTEYLQSLTIAPYKLRSMQKSSTASLPINFTDESSAIETPPRRKKRHQRDNLEEGEKYQQVAVLESEVQVDSYIRENNQCGFIKAQKNRVNCTLKCSNSEVHKMVAAYFKCSCLQADCNLR